jgi:hypothetical protein
VKNIPLPALVADGVGTILLGLGVYEIFGDGVVPENLQFPGYQWIMVGIGLLLISILVVNIFKITIQKQSKDDR